MSETTRVKVRFCGLIKEVTGGEEFTILIEPGATPSELCHSLGERYGLEYYRRIFQGNGELDPCVFFVVNGRKLDISEHDDQSVLEQAEKFEVFLLPLMMGG